jgi:hypothetical protein
MASSYKNALSQTTPWEISTEHLVVSLMQMGTGEMRCSHAVLN